MSKRLRGFAVSWFFAPYLGSADLDFFKRIKGVDAHFDVVQVKRAAKDDRVLRFIGDATLTRYEVTTDHQNPRTRKTRDDFKREALQLFEQNRAEYDFIISHSNEVPSHAVALECKRRMPRLPWIAYFGDVVSTNPYVRLLSSYPLHDEDIETEALTLEHADVIVCNNEHQRKLMFSGPMEKFASKAVVIPHCFDPAMFSSKPLPRNDRFTFMHVGTLYHTRRVGAPLMQAADRLIEIYPKYANRFEVVFYGGGYYQGDLDAHANLRNRHHVRLEGSVPYLESLELMRKADVLVNIDGIFTKEADNLEFNPFFPGKLTDYMGAGRPIMGITMNDGPTADILRESRNMLADSRLDRIAYVMKCYLDGRVRPNHAVFKRFDVAYVGGEMEAVIKAACRGESVLRALGGTLESRSEALRLAQSSVPEVAVSLPRPEQPRLLASTPSLEKRAEKKKEPRKKNAAARRASR